MPIRSYSLGHQEISEYEDGAREMRLEKRGETEKHLQSLKETAPWMVSDLGGGARALS